MGCLLPGGAVLGTCRAGPGRGACIEATVAARRRRFSCRSWPKDDLLIGTIKHKPSSFGL